MLGDKLNRTNRITHSIPTMDNVPIVVKQYRYPSIHKKEIKQQINKLLEQDYSTFSFAIQFFIMDSTMGRNLMLMVINNGN